MCITTKTNHSSTKPQNPTPTCVRNRLRCGRDEGKPVHRYPTFKSRHQCTNNLLSVTSKLSAAFNSISIVSVRFVCVGIRNFITYVYRFCVQCNSQVTDCWLTPNEQYVSYIIKLHSMR